MLANPEYFLVPLLLAFVGFFFKVLSRKTVDVGDIVQDFAVGPELTLSAIVLASTKGLRLLHGSVPNPPQLFGTDAGTACLGLAVGLVVGLLAVAVVIRLWGWKADNQLRVGTGIIFPLIAGLASLSLVASTTRSLP